MIELTPVRKERIQGKITKIILADEEPEVLAQIIAVNELTEEQAREMVQVARKERINQIRRGQMKNLYLGCLILLLGLGAVYGFAMLIGYVTKPVWILSLLIMAQGLGCVVLSVVKILLAGLKKGPVGEE
jgi:hypothetical protein